MNEEITWLNRPDLSDPEDFLKWLEYGSAEGFKWEIVEVPHYTYGGIDLNKLFKYKVNFAIVIGAPENIIPHISETSNLVLYDANMDEIGDGTNVGEIRLLVI